MSGRRATAVNDVKMSASGVDAATSSTNDTHYTKNKALPVNIDHISQETRDWHTEMLLGLFLQSNEAELAKLADHAGFDPNTLDCAKNSIKCRESRVTEYSSFSLLPDILGSFTQPDQVPQPRKSKETLIDTPLAWQRPGHASLSTEQLEHRVKLKFDDTFIGSALKGSGGDPQEVEKNARKRKGPSLESNTETKVPSASFKPFTLLFNECTLFAMSRWAAKGKPTSQHCSTDNTDLNSKYFPAAPPPFRLCSCCGKWGHYEVECENMKDDDVLQLAPEIRIQETMEKFIAEERASNRDKPNENSSDDVPVLPETTRIGNDTGILVVSSKKSQDVSKGKDTLFPEILTMAPIPSPKADAEYDMRHSSCTVCDSGFRAQDILLCDGCDAPYHFQCLDPPLESVPDGDWFCPNCCGYESDVSSVLDVECCEGFVIEQGKSTSIMESQSTYDKDSAKPSIDSWTGTVHIWNRVKSKNAESDTPAKDNSVSAKRSPAVPTSSVSKRPSQKRTRQRGKKTMGGNANSDPEEEAERVRPATWSSAEVTEQDGFAILSKNIEPKEGESSSSTGWSSASFFLGVGAHLYQTKQANGDAASGSNRVKSTNIGPSSPIDPDKLVGCIVTWYTRLHDDTPRSLPLGASGSNKPLMLLGSVVSVDRSSHQALVRTIPDLQKIASSGKSTPSQQTAPTSETLRVAFSSSCNLGSSLWIPIDSLHLISEAPHPRVVASTTDETNHNELDSGRARNKWLGRSPRLVTDSFGISQRGKHSEISITKEIAKFRTKARSARGSGKDVRSVELPRKSKFARYAASSTSVAQSRLSKTFPGPGVASAGPSARESEVFQAERILDERLVRAGGGVVKQFLIKWKSFDMEDCTWEPEENILSQNLLRIYKVESLIKELSSSMEAHDCSSVTCRVIEALEEGRGRLLANGGEKFDPVGRVCPFCQNWFKTPAGLAGHLRVHSSEPNFSAIREASRLGYDQVFCEGPKKKSG